MASSHPAWPYWSDATVLDEYAMTTTTTTSIVTVAVSVAVCEIFSVKNGVTLKTRLGVVQGH